MPIVTGQFTTLFAGMIYQMPGCLSELNPAVGPILDRMGYDRVLKGAQAFNDLDSSGDWSRCFLGRAYEAEQHESYNAYQAIALFRSPNEMQTIAFAFDYQRTQFQEFVTEWLLNPANQTRVPECEPSSGHSTSSTDESSWMSIGNFLNETPSGTTTPAEPSLSLKAVPVPDWTTVTDKVFPALEEALDFTSTATALSTSP